MTPHLKTVMEMLLAGKVAEARRLFEGEFSRELEKRRADLHAAEQENALLHSLISVAERNQPQGGGPATQSDGASAKAPATAPALRKLSKSKQQPVIMDIAFTIAAKDGGRVSTEAVIQGLRDRGYELNSAVPGTSIGNILFRAEGWKRIDRGVFAAPSPPH